MSGVSKRGLSRAEESMERSFRELSRFFTKRGVSVRRENLPRGHSFRAKSGNCELSGRNLIFVDKRLPIQQQLAVLSDYLVDFNLEISEEEISSLSEECIGFLAPVIGSRKIEISA